jgi:hypothetical protein
MASKREGKELVVPIHRENGKVVTTTERGSSTDTGDEDVFSLQKREEDNDASDSAVVSASFAAMDDAESIAATKVLQRDAGTASALSRIENNMRVLNSQMEALYRKLTDMHIKAIEGKTPFERSRISSLAQSGFFGCCTIAFVTSTVAAVIIVLVLVISSFFVME